MTKTNVKRRLKQALMILPPILFLVYTFHSFNVIRSLMSSSSTFHMDYADNLIEDFLELEINAEIGHLEACLLAAQENCDNFILVTLEPGDEPIRFLSYDRQPVYLRHNALAQNLPVFFTKMKGLSTLFTERFHEPIYWFRILDPQGETVYRSTQKPAPAEEGAENRARYAMDRTLRGYELDIVYNSFGAKQLYSVARNRINFGLILFLFVMAVFSGGLIMATIRGKLVLARQKSFFVSTVSHEFKTPLAIMKLAVETLAAKRFKTEEDEARFRNMLVNELNRLNQLVHKILSFNKIETHQIHFQNQNVDAHEVLEPSLEIFRARALADKVALDIDIDEETLPIFGDAGLIRHAVDNIIENAFKYRGESDTIKISLKKVRDTAVLSVQDYGLGIAPEDQNQIFKSFYRITNPRTEGIRGSGLGLAISKYILDKAKAELSVESTLGEGSTFSITFPLSASAN